MTHARDRRHPPSHRPHRRPRRVAHTLAALATLAAAAAVAPGCLTRDVTTRDPDQKSAFSTLVRTGGIDKVDLLFVIDNSASMGDKQALLKDAVPDLLERMVRPPCMSGGKVVGSFATKGGCPAGSEPAWKPLRDLHVGIITSSLGGVGSTACSDPRRHDDDGARLVARTGREAAVAEAGPQGFLAYLPEVEENAGRPRDPSVVGATPFVDSTELVRSFQRLVVGVGEDGCGYEAPLEAAYRFLVEPEPYERVERRERTELLGLDGRLLEQRSRFLRPDSLVAVVLVTDENESTIDPLAFGGTASRFLDPAPLPPGTEVCGSDPESPACVSCASSTAAGDARCSREPTAPNDDPNVRFFDPKGRFGVDPRFPLSRYVGGFSEPRVPARDGKRECTNPLFAARLPSGPGGDLCNLDRGLRSSRDVLFAVVGGVPWQLLTEAPDDLSEKNGAPFKEELTAADWTRLLGPKSRSRRFEGAHPLLRESLTPRPNVSNDGAHTAEWETHGKDLQYACTFPLETPRECAPHDDSCDCGATSTSPLCDPAARKRQVRGKAYPSLSALAVARDLGERAVVASICPRETSDKASASYGYRPAMGALATRIKDQLFGSCVPPLHPTAEGHVRCLVLEAQPPGVAGCDDRRGRRPADESTLARLRVEAEGTLDGRTVCAVDQVTQAERAGLPCADAARPGYCYVTGAEAPKRCGQALSFSKTGAPLAGTNVYLQCIDAR